MTRVVLVAGADGQVGQNLQKYADEFFVKVVAFNHRDLDITNKNSISAVMADVSPNAVINAAAYVAVDKAESDQVNAYLANEMGPKLLAEACAFADVPLLHISTDYVFDGIKSTPYSELDAVNPQNVYGASKEAGERAVRSVLRKHIILRTSWVFSAEGKNFVKTMLKLASERDQLSVVDNQFGGPTSASAIAKTLLTLVGKEDLAWGTYHFSQLPYVSWFEFAQKIFYEAELIGRIHSKVEVSAVPFNSYNSIVARPANSRLDSSKLLKSNSLNVDLNWLADLRKVIQSVDCLSPK